ncbi:sulfotransferase family protein [Paenibacillus gansuensis]|uniref:Sulfotransferase family protein n=1 Tax=Paenibacillus gansuensis TaxID=306542 RepID=A0ABW5PHU5_9BACL
MNGDNRSIYKPVFIGGCPRSGTTLLGSMLGAHSESICVPESQFKIGLISKFKTYSNNIELLKKDLFNNKRFKLWQVDAKEVKNYLINNSITIQDLLDFLVESYSTNHKKKTSMWIDHTPNNIMYIRTLNNTFNNAKFIHVIRDGRAVLASIRKTDWALKNENIQKLSTYWASQVSYGLAAESFFPESVYRVRYEDILTNTEEVIKGICEYLNIQFEESMLSTTGFVPPEYTKLQHQLIGGGLQSNRKTAWELELSKAEIEQFEYYTGDLLSYLGYGQSNRMLSFVGASGEEIMDFNFLEKEINRLLTRYRREQNIK